MITCTWPCPRVKTRWRFRNDSNSLSSFEFSVLSASVMAKMLWLHEYTVSCSRIWAADYLRTWQLAKVISCNFTLVFSNKITIFTLTEEYYTLPFPHERFFKLLPASFSSLSEPRHTCLHTLTTSCMNMDWKQQPITDFDVGTTCNTYLASANEQ